MLGIIYAILLWDAYGAFFHCMMNFSIHLAPKPSSKKLHIHPLPLDSMRQKRSSYIFIWELLHPLGENNKHGNLKICSHGLLIQIR
jgi:hypothetical protein